MKRCPDCGRKYPDEARFCAVDAVELELLDETPKDPLVGRTLLGRYRVLARLDGGAFGTVYRVENLGLGRVEALKLLRFEALSSVDSLSPDERRRLVVGLRDYFEGEKWFLVRLDEARSRHIAGIYDGGILPAREINRPEDVPYFTMEYVRGRTLEGLILEDGPLEISRTVRLLRQICQGLIVAHELEVSREGEFGDPQCGIVHRDLKLRNVMVSGDASNEVAKILDFGIAKVVGDAPSKLTRMFSGSPGTPGYMPPEQLKGEVDARTDLFALGVLAYELLAGHDPWEGRPVGMARSQPGSYQPLPLERFRDDVPVTLQALIQGLLAEAPENRPPSARNVDAALAQVEKGPRREADRAGKAPDGQKTRVVPATLEVFSEPSGVDLALLRDGDGKVLGTGSAPCLFRLEPDTYRIAVRDPRHRGAECVVELRPGEKASVRLAPEREFSTAAEASGKGIGAGEIARRIGLTAAVAGGVGVVLSAVLTGTVSVTGPVPGQLYDALMVFASVLTVAVCARWLLSRWYPGRTAYLSLAASLVAAPVWWLWIVPTTGNRIAYNFFFYVLGLGVVGLTQWGVAHAVEAWGAAPWSEGGRGRSRLGGYAALAFGGGAVWMNWGRTFLGAPPDWTHDAVMVSAVAVLTFGWLLGRERGPPISPGFRSLGVAGLGAFLAGFLLILMVARTSRNLGAGEAIVFSGFWGGSGALVLALVARGMSAASYRLGPVAGLALVALPVCAVPYLLDHWLGPWLGGLRVTTWIPTAIALLVVAHREGLGWYTPHRAPQAIHAEGAARGRAEVLEAQ